MPKPLDQVIAEVKADRADQAEQWGRAEERPFEEHLLLFQQFASEVGPAFAHNAGNDETVKVLKRAINAGLAALQTA